MTSATEGWVPAPEPPPEDNFGSRLRRIRRHLDLSTDEIAPMCGIRAVTWRSWEALGSRPRGMNEVVNRIAAATGVDRNWLMWGEPPDFGRGAPLPDDPPDSPGGQGPAISVMSTRRLLRAS